MPEGLNPRNLREKAVPTEVKSPTVPLDGPTYAANLAVRLEDIAGDAVPSQFVRSCQPCRPSALPNVNLLSIKRVTLAASWLVGCRKVTARAPGSMNEGRA